jgi:excisionase family DNA binding protein
METMIEASTATSVRAATDDPAPLRLLNAAQAGEALNISARQVYNEVREGRLTAIRIGTRVLFRPSDILDFVESRATRTKH